MNATNVLADRTNLSQDQFNSPVKRSVKQHNQSDEHIDEHFDEQFEHESDHLYTPSSIDLSDDELCRSLSKSLGFNQSSDGPSSPDSERLPAPFVSINPSILGDQRWAYRDLQKLCMSLGLGGRGNRAALLDKLRRWHRTEFDESKRSVPAHEVSLPSNFALLDLGISDLTSASAENNPELTPLTSRPQRNKDGTPKSILTTPIRRAREQEGKRRLSFSMFNGVCLIPSRQQQKAEIETAAEPTIQPNPACQSSPPRVPMPRVAAR